MAICYRGGRMTEEQHQEIVDLLKEVKDIIVDIGKVLESSAQMLKIIASNSQEQTDYNSWKKY